MNITWSANEEDYKAIQEIAESENDRPVLMININKYLPSAGYPYGEPYKTWMKVLSKMEGEVGGKILRQVPSYGQPIGQQSAEEILAAWYPSHKAYLSIKDQPSSVESFRLRELCVSGAVVHRCPDGVIPYP